MASTAIPRASTCPAFSSSGGSSPRALPSWRRSPWQRPGGASGALAAAAPGLLGRLSSRALLLATLALYTLALLGLPLLYTTFGRRLSGGGSPELGGGGDLQAAALAEGVLQPPPLLARALVASRRLALEGGSRGAAAALWPDAGLAERHFGATTAQLPRVEYRDAGNIVALIDALNISQWDELPLYHPGPLPDLAAQAPGQAPGSTSSGSSGSDSEQRQPGGSGGSGMRFPAQCPQSDIRLFIGITSRCCTADAQAKRDIIRKTWVQHAKDHLPNVHVRFILAQPSTEADMRAAMELLKGEIQQHADVIIVPGQDLYRNLPSKTLQLLKYALSSDCQYTRIMKVDDDVYLRPQKLMDIITQGRYNFSVGGAYSGSGEFDGQAAPYFQSPWMSGMYVGQLDSLKGGIYPGWKPNRDPKSKWYLSQEDLPDQHAPLGVRWASGWGYMLSRDLAAFISNTAHMYAAMPDKKPLWWGRMPWEDILVGSLLSGVARVHHHDGFKAAWQDCDRLTVLKHLDYDAPALQEGLYIQEVSGLWAKKDVVCSSGVFEPNNHTDWRRWRNSLPDNQLGGFM